MQLNRNQKLILQAAFSGLPMHRLCMIADRGDSFGSFATINDEEVRTAIASRISNLSRGTDVLVFPWPITSAVVPSFTRYYVVDENAQRLWTELDGQPLWPPDPQLLGRLKTQLQPHRRKSEKILSDRNLGFFSIVAGFMWGLGIGQGDVLWNIPTAVMFSQGFAWLYKYFIGDARKQRRFRLETLDAMLAEGIAFPPSKSSASVSTLKPRSA
jgi:hypothetical protein